jgi:hypothetical protein
MVRDPALFAWCIFAAVFGVMVLTASGFNWRGTRHPSVLIAAPTVIAVMVYLLITQVRW